MSTDLLLTDALIQQFEAAAVRDFSHRDHLHVAWHYLHALPLELALARFVQGLRRLTLALGAPQKFHTTISWAYVVLLHEAIAQAPDEAFDQLLARRPELLMHPHGALATLYSPAQLAADAARERFVFPERRS